MRVSSRTLLARVPNSAREHRCACPRQPFTPLLKQWSFTVHRLTFAVQRLTVSTVHFMTHNNNFIYPPAISVVVVSCLYVIAHAVCSPIIGLSCVLCLGLRRDVCGVAFCW